VTNLKVARKVVLIVKNDDEANKKKADV